MRDQSRTRLVMVLTFMLASLPLAAGAGEEVRPAAPSTQPAYKKPEKLTFVRIRKDKAGKPAALQVATVRYAPTDGSKLSVTLYSAVHVADKAFYERLNRSFAKREVLLYELANDPEVLHETNREPSVLSMFQMDMAGMLGLSKQLDEIDYDRPNFVHADIPIDELIQHAQSQGESMLTVTAQTLLDIQRMMNRGDDPMAAIMGTDDDDQSASQGPWESLFGSTGDPRTLKLQLAQQLVSQGRDGMLEGITVLNRYLIGARNDRCMEVLDQQIAKGKTDIGIFYGAGHNPDFHRRLMADYGLKPVEVTWNDAWDLKAEVKPASRNVDEMSDQELLMHLMRRMMEGDR